MLMDRLRSAMFRERHRGHCPPARCPLHLVRVRGGHTDALDALVKAGRQKT